MPTIKVSDINVYYELHGAGESLVLITGLANDVTQYIHITDRLSREFNVLAFDNRGAGRTDKPDTPYTIEQMADDTAGLMDAVGTGPAHLIGVSMGGRTAMALALQYPEKVKSLILVSTFARQVHDPAKKGFSGLISRIPNPMEGIGEYPQPRHDFERQLMASRSYDCSDRLGEIHVPTLVLHGKDDTLVPLALAEELHADIAGSKMTVFDGGHGFFMTMPEKFCDTVSAFLTGVK